MSLDLDARQRAMLAEMGVKLWTRPGAPAPSNAIESKAVRAHLAPAEAPNPSKSGIERVETTYLEYDGQVIGIDNKGDSYKIAPDGERTPLNGGDEEIPLSSLAEAAIKLTDDLTMGVSVDPLLPLESYLLQCE